MTMRVAIPVFNGRISPVFDWTNTLVVIDFDRHRELRRETMSISGIPPLARPGHLQQLRVDVLVCGGISRQLCQLVEHQCISVFPWLSGELDAVLEQVVAGEAAVADPDRGTDTGSPDQSASTPQTGRTECQTRK